MTDDPHAAHRLRDADQRGAHAAARLRHLADQGLDQATEAPSAGARRPATGTSTPPPSTATRARSARRWPRAAWPATTSSSPPSARRASRPRARHAAREPRPARHRPRRPVADPLARRRRRRRRSGGSFVEAREQGLARDIGVSNFDADHDRPAHLRDRRDARGQPDRVEPAAVRRDRASRQHRERGVVARGLQRPARRHARAPGRSPGSPSGSAARRPR